MKITFCRLLDSQRLRAADVIVVLRNHDRAKTQQRYQHALNLLHDKLAPLVVMSDDENTYAEALRIFELAMELMWKTVLIVTHRSHHYRAYLTFVKAFEFSGIEIVSSPVDDNWDTQEFEKIIQYHAAGHVASYEEGIECLTSPCSD